MHFNFFSIPFSTTSFDRFVLLFSLDFGTLNPQNAASYAAKTDNCLKLSFLKQIDQILCLAPFWDHFVIIVHDFREFVRYLFFH